MINHKLSLKIVGFIFVVFAIVHTVWTFFFDGYQELKELNNLQLGIIYIFNWATISFQATIAGIIFWFIKGKTFTNSHLRILTYFVIFFLLSRLIIDFFYPVQIPIIIIRVPNILIRILILVPVCLLFIPEIKLFVKRNG